MMDRKEGKADGKRGEGHKKDLREGMKEGKVRKMGRRNTIGYTIVTNDAQDHYRHCHLFTRERKLEMERNS